MFEIIKEDKKERGKVYYLRINKKEVGGGWFADKVFA